MTPNTVVRAYRRTLIVLAYFFLGFNAVAVVGSVDHLSGWAVLFAVLAAGGLFLFGIVMFVVEIEEK